MKSEPSSRELREGSHRPDDVQIRVVLSANDAVGESSAVALDRTANAAPSPSAEMAVEISATRSSGIVAPRSHRGFRGERGNRRPRPAQGGRAIDRSSTDASAMIRSNASVVTQKPGGTDTPRIRDSSPRFAPFPPTATTIDPSISSNVHDIATHPHSVLQFRVREPRAGCRSRRERQVPCASGCSGRSASPRADAWPWAQCRNPPFPRRNRPVSVGDQLRRELARPVFFDGEDDPRRERVVT